MTILVTGVRGFLGAVLEQQAVDAGWAVDGIDLDLYQAVQSNGTPGPRAEFQELTEEHLAGYDAVVHLAAISSDAACDLRADSAVRANGAAAVEFARRAKRAGVRRFVFASSCSVYGSAPARISNEGSRCSPISAYARSKLAAEIGIRAEASSAFSPTVLRFATLYGLSPNLRSDLVVNTMVAAAHMNGEINLHGTGEQSRPLLHVRDAASTILDVLKSSEDEMRGQVFNVTDDSTGYSIAEIAELVRRRVPGSHVKRHPAATDRRHYRVDGTRIRRFCQRRAVQLEEGLAEVSDNMRSADWQRKAAAPQSNRAGRLRHLLEQGELNDDLRWRR
jgi:nucleoside-diphosphate-sugar epimerase